MSDKTKNKDKDETGWKKSLKNISTTPIAYKCQPLIEHHNKDILNRGSNFIVIVGESGCGKTVLLNVIVPMFKAQNIIICTVIKDNDVHWTIYNWARTKQLDACIVTDLDKAEEAVDIAKRKFMDHGMDYHYHTLIVLDDFSAYRNGRDNDLNNFAIRVYSTMRNCGFSFVLVTQDYSNVPTLVRTNLSHIFVFPFNNHHGLVQLKSDVKQRMTQWKDMKQPLLKNKGSKKRKLSEIDDDDKENKKIKGDDETSIVVVDKSGRKLTDKEQFDAWWRKLWERISDKPYTFCLFKKPDSIYINFDKIY